VLKIKKTLKAKESAVTKAAISGKSSGAKSGSSKHAVDAESDQEDGPSSETDEDEALQKFLDEHPGLAANCGERQETLDTIKMEINNEVDLMFLLAKLPPLGLSCDLKHRVAAQWELGTQGEGDVFEFVPCRFHSLSTSKNEYTQHSVCFERSSRI